LDELVPSIVESKLRQNFWWLKVMGEKVLFFCKLKEWLHCYGDVRFQWCSTLDGVFLFFMLERFGCMMHCGLDNASYGAMGFTL